MSRLSDRRARAAAAVDRAFGERLRIEPQRAGGAVVGGPDPSRPPLEAIGKFIEANHVTRPQGEGANSSKSTDLRGSRYAVSFADTALAGVTLRQGDHIVRLEAEGGPAFRITATAPSPRGRIRFNLVPVGGAP